MEEFDVSNIILGNLVYDHEIKNWISKISYIQLDNCLMLQVPLVQLKRLVLETSNNYNRIKMYTAMTNPNENFIKIVSNIENHICKKIQKMKCFESYNIKAMFQSFSNENKIYKFFIPIYENSIDILITDKDEKKISIKNLEKNCLISCIVYLSHVEIEQNKFYLNWNIIQIKLE